MPEPELLAEGRFVRLIREGRWEYADRVNCSGAAAIMAFTADREIVLTEQFRIPLKKRVIDLPAGLVGDVAGEEEESFETAARRELVEETGYEAGEMEFAFEGPLSAGMTTEVVSFFYVPNARRVHEGGGDDSEEIEVHVVPVTDLIGWLDERRQQGILVDPKIYSAMGWMLCKEHGLSR